MLEQEAVALSKEKEGYVPVKVIAGTINTKNRVDTCASLPKDQLVVGNTIEFLGGQWAIKMATFAVLSIDKHYATIFIVPLE